MTRGGRPSGIGGWIRTRATSLSVIVLAALAYIPSLASSPGRMPADTKLYLYLEPAQLLGRASSTFEREQFGGWVPHQQITYLWPSGPWYWILDSVGLPDWVAHRLWIGTILFAAGAGVLWLTRRLGLTIGAALVAGLVYQLSPYLLPYISRTSLLLLPWAALGWLVGLTVLACRDDPTSGGAPPRWQRWRYPAMIALVVATVGSVNATALALVAPAPLLWLIHAGWMGDVRWRRAIAIAVRTAVLCVAVSLWWIAMLLVQSRYGAPVLAYSETLEDVSRNATGSEVLRGLGYWLFYVRDPVAPTTTASEGYLVSTGGIAVSYAVTLVGLVGLVATRWPARRFAALLILVGVVLAVGVHAIDSPSPLMSLFATDDGSGLALALRSSTRATPLIVLGLALGAAGLVGSLPATRVRRGGGRWSPRLAAGSLVALLALVNLPALWGLDLVDAAIDRDQDPPAAWREAADSLGDRTGARVLQLPGAEFGAFRWGYTVDQPLVALTDRPLVTRDLLPLGSGAAMNLLYALDDRVQEGTLEPRSIQPVARLLGVDTIWLANDLQFERFRTPRPEALDALLGDASADGFLGAITYFGDPVTNVPDVSMVDPAALAGVARAIAPVGLIEIDDPIGVVRAKPDSIVLSGDGDGLVDAAAAGLITGSEAVRYSASLDGSDLAAAAKEALAVIITDTNRDRAHHWRGSQDVHGHTEPGGPGIDVLTPTAADQRLELFGDDDPERQTIAIQEGPVVATASSYGEPFAYRPEDRAVMAIDGDPTTAWLVGDHGDPVGERIELATAQEADSLALRQAVPAHGGRTIVRVAVSVAGDDGEVVKVVVDLTDESLDAGGQFVLLPRATPGTVTIEILAVTGGTAGVGFTEIDAGLGPTTEWIRPPVDAVEAAAERPLAITLTRLRVDALDPWRSDPEPELQRIIEMPDDRAIEASVTLRLDAWTDDETLAGVIAPDDPGSLATASDHLTGAPRHAGMFAADGDPTTAWITPFDGAVGATLTIPLADTRSPETSIDLIQPVGPYSVVTALELTDGSGTIVVDVPAPDPTGRSTVDLQRPLAGDRITLRITAIEPSTTVDRRYGDVVTLPTAIAEVESAAIVAVAIDGSTVIAAACRSDLLTLDDSAVALSYATTVGELLDGAPVDAEVCAGPLELIGGEHTLRSHARSAGLTVDRIVLSDQPPSAVGTALVPVTIERDDTRGRRVAVESCPQGCWIVLGEGYNDAWEASADGTDLGPPQLIDGGFNGWWLPPTTTVTTVDLHWTAQRPVKIGLLASIVAVVGCLLIIAATRRRDRRDFVTPRPMPGGGGIGPRPWIAPAVLLVLGALLIAPVWGLVGGVLGVVVMFVKRIANLLGWIGVGLALLVALLVMWIERRDHPLPNAGWTESFDHLNGLAVFAVLCATVGVIATSSDRVRSSCAP